MCWLRQFQLPPRKHPPAGSVLGDQPVLEARFHRAVSMNPYLRFHVRAEPKELSLRWRDDTGRSVDAGETLRPR